MSHYRLAIDIGGTFTDVVLETADKSHVSAKSPTTPSNPVAGAVDGIDKVLGKAGIELHQVGMLVHGTTLATNTLIEKKGARVGAILTEGFRDILEIGYERRYKQEDLFLDKPDLLVPRDRCLAVRERISSSGAVLTPLDEVALQAVLKRFDQLGVESVAVCLLHAYANPAHENRIADLIARARPDLVVSLSSGVSPEIREFDRLCTTIANAYVKPSMASYLDRFGRALEQQGFTGAFFVMTSAGGMTTIETAKRYPIRLVESGPSGGAILAARVAQHCGLDRVVSFDMGGTTAKFCLIDGGIPLTSRNFEAARAERFTKGSGMPLRIPAIEMIEIGAGGGSVAAVDALDRFDLDGVNALLARMAREARGIVNLDGASLTETRSAFMRYAGQGHEIEVALPARPLERSDFGALANAYDRVYREQFKRTVPGMPIEIMNWALRVKNSAEPESSRPAVTDEGQPVAEHWKSIYLGPEYGSNSTPVYDRDKLNPGDRIDGPALIVEAQTSTLLEPEFTACVDSVGNLLLTRHHDQAPKQADRVDDSVIDRQLMWNRLLAVVEEQAQALIRGAFSPIVRECGDISAGIFDRRGRMLAQAVTGTPGHINTMAAGVSNFLDAYPLPEMQPGDIYVTNDPWLAAGHLNDFMLVQPVFKDGEVAGFTSCTSHLIDVGGKCMGPEGTDVYDEGLRIPICRLVSHGEVNRPLLDIIAANSRHPTENEGDLYALIACCEVGANRLLSMMDEYALASLDDLAEHIIESSQRATTAAIRKLPNGKYEHAITLDGYELDIVLKATLAIEDEHIALDFSGSAPCSKFGINVPLNYAAAYSVFAIRCAVGPGIPNNAGSLAPFRVTAPEGCILNAMHPAPVAMRHTIGQLLPDLVFGCLHQALPDVVPAEGASCMYDLPIRSLPATAKTRFAVELVHNGGTGARPHKDGLSATAYPSGVWGSQVEVTECTAPLRVRRRELRPDSGGPGRYRGGLGQIIEIESAEDEDFLLFLSLDRVEHPACGRAGGSCGSTGLASLSSGSKLPGRGEAVVPRGERLVFLTPGGAGHGSPLDRDPESVRQDVVRGLVSATAARDAYGVVLDACSRLDLAATHALRSTKSC